MSSNKGTSGVKSSFDAFSKVDEIVSKPILGSDGAASWQEFQKDVHKSTSIGIGSHPHRPSAAPKAPLKKADRLGTGFSSWEEERLHEEQVRKAAGHVSAGTGYTNFKKKNSAEEAAERKRIKKIEARIRPDNKEYFIPAPTFQGWKFDYIFTTRPDRGTGYYWDGMDSVKKLRGALQEGENDGDTQKGEEDEKASGEEEHDKPKKKKRKKSAGPVIVNDPNNPLEQVAALIEQRRRQMMAPTAVVDPTLLPGWEMANDTTSGKPYYFNRSTGERSWDKPQAVPGATSTSELKDSELPEGWKEATDGASGKTYYYHTNGETRWDRPTI
jgi:hypothetical protein